MWSVEQLIFEGGERYPMLVDKKGLPHYWISLFVTICLRPSLSQNSITNVISHLRHFLLWQEINKRDLIEEIKQQRFLSKTDVYDLRDHCALDSKQLRKWYENSQKPNVARFSRTSSAVSRSFDRVSKDHQRNRLKTIADFLAFTANATLRNRSGYNDILEKITDVSEAILAQRPAGTSRNVSSDPDSKAPPPKVFEKIMEITRAESSHNPFLSIGVRVRNSSMFDLLYETGARSGEILSAQINDIDRHNSTIHFGRNHDDRFDPRAHQPVAKTLARTVKISRNSMDALYKYVMEVRSTISGANKHPYVFVTHKKGKFQGRPISDSSFRNRVLGPVLQFDPVLMDEVVRHGFRHNYHYRLGKMIEKWNAQANADPKKKVISEKEEMQIRMYVSGWRSESSAAVYNLRYIKEIADALLIKDANDLMSFVEVDHE